MDTKKIWIITLGTLVLSIIIIFGTITYYNQRVEQAQIPNGKQSVLRSYQHSPADPGELLYFIDYCKNVVLFSDLEELNNQEIREGVCTVERELRELALEDNTLLVSNYTPSFSSLDSIISFEPDNYIGIVVDLKGVVRKYNPSLLEKDKLYFCSISEPSWADQFYLQTEPDQDLIFDEGDVSCGGIKTEGTHTIFFSGSIPQAESLNIKQYLVNEQTVSDVMNKKSFLEIKEILKNYPIIWQMEKPINL